MAQLRRLGVFGENLPTKKTLNVRPSDFSIGAVIGLFERKFDRSYVVNNINEFRTIFGNNIFASYYGWDSVQGFFNNILGVTGKLYIKSHVGYTGSAIDAVVANLQLDDKAGAPQKTLKLKAGYLNEPEYGVSGNRTGFTITSGNRFETVLGASVAPADTSAVLQSVSGIKIGDVMKFIATGTGGATIYKKLTNVVESTKTVTWTGAFHATASGVSNDVATVLGFRLRTYRKNINGIVDEVEAELGKVWCTMEPEVTDFYVANVMKQNKWLIAEDLAVTEASPELPFPADVSATTYLASGADGTTPTTYAHYSQDVDKLKNDPFRFICLPETTDEDIQRSLETAMKNRAKKDCPKVLFNIASNRNKTQLIDIGHRFQRSDDVLGVIPANWLQITDPFSNSPIAPPREVPNVGHVMGAWVRVIGQKGVHYVPAVKDNPIIGIVGIVGDQFLDDTDRTDIANAGVNLIQFIQGSGYVIRNFFTPSTSTEFQFANGILMREYIKISAVDSLQASENTPNSFNRIKEDKTAILNFLYRLWAVGSTGNVPPGESFGQLINDDGSSTTPENHFQVQADAVNNPASSVQAGERNLDVYFTYPAPAGSIKIGVGILLLN